MTVRKKEAYPVVQAVIGNVARFDSHSSGELIKATNVDAKNWVIVTLAARVIRLWELP